MCQTLCDPMDSSPPGSSVLGIFQAGLLHWGAPPEKDLPDPGIERASPVSPALPADSLPTKPWRKPQISKKRESESHSVMSDFL